MEQETISMEVVNPQAAGIDVGSRSHWVAVGHRTGCSGNAEHSRMPLKTNNFNEQYGVFNQDLFDMADWLKEKGIKTVPWKCGAFMNSIKNQRISE